MKDIPIDKLESDVDSIIEQTNSEDRLLLQDFNSEIESVSIVVQSSKS